MVSEIQGECVLSETILPGLCDFTYSVPHIAEPRDVDESVDQCNGRLGHLGNSERGEATDNRMHRECDPDDAIHRDGDVDVRREDRKRREEDTVAKRKDSAHLLDKH